MRQRRTRLTLAQIQTAIEFITQLSKGVKEPMTLKRISQHVNLDPFPDADVPNVKVDTLIGQELVINDFEGREITQEGEKVPGMAILFTIEETGEQQKTLTFSQVLTDQLSKLTLDYLPCLARIEEQGSGIRKYLSMV